MDKVLTICDNYAILKKGSPAKKTAEKELAQLLDIKQTDADYLEKQITPYLDLYGRRLAVDVRLHPVIMSSRGLPDKHLKKFGYYEYETPGGRFALNRTDKSDNDTYVVMLRSGSEGCDAGGYSLFQLQDAMMYAAKLALLSQNGTNCGLAVAVDHDGHAAPAVVFADVPMQLSCFDEIFLENIFNRQIDSIVADYGRIVRAGKNINVELDSFTSDFPLCDAVDIVRAAASILLVCLMRTYHFGAGQYVVDCDTGGIVEQGTSNLLQAVVASVASGKMHTCPYCGRPMLGKSTFCRNGGCYQRLSEKVQAQLEVGLSVDDAIKKYGNTFKPTTIKRWAAKLEGR